MTLNTVLPILRIFDVEKAHEFYIDYLGFRVDWQHRFEENFPLYFQVSKDSCILHLSEHHGDASPGSSIRIQCTDIHQYHQLLHARQYNYAKPALEKTPWDTLELKVLDPFYNRLIFWQEVTASNE